MNASNIFWAIYVLSFFYCMWRLHKRYKKASLDGVIGPTPGLDILAVVFIAPILAIADLVVTGIMLAKRQAYTRVTRFIFWEKCVNFAYASISCGRL